MKPSQKNIFREKPPADFLNTAIATIAHGTVTLSNRIPFTKDSIDLEAFSDLLLEIHPYYIPSKNPIETIPLSYSLAITVLRHLVRESEYYILEVKQKGRITWYTILPSPNQHPYYSDPLDFS